VDQTELTAILTETAERGPFVQNVAELSNKSSGLARIPSLSRHSSRGRSQHGVPHAPSSRVNHRPRLSASDLSRYDRCDANWPPRSTASHHSYTDMTDRTQG
jgi:hypothetical protein